MKSIVTERLVIRRFTAEDGQDLYAYLSDREVVRFEPYDVFTQAQAAHEAARRACDEAFYAVCLKQENKLIGNLYLGKGDYETYELGYVFNRFYQGRGYAAESAAALVNDAFLSMGARRIVAMCSADNTRSLRLLERLGMRREGLLLQNIYFKKDSNGQPIWLNTYTYALLKGEWNKSKEKGGG